MLGKQWLNRYVATDMRGTAIERSQNRQRKLDGVVTWYFDHVMESLPLMLQAALLLLGCALSRYFLGIDIAVASVVLGVTLVGIILYIFIVVAGAASESCPYQTPGARFFRYIFPHILLPALRSTPTAISKLPIFVFNLPVLVFSALSSIRSKFGLSPPFSYQPPVGRRLSPVRPWHSLVNIPIYLLLALRVSVALVIDACLLGPAILWLLVNSGQKMYHSFVASARTGYCQFIAAFPRTHDQQTVMLDLRCFSWMLQTSLDKAVHLSTLKYLAAMMALPDFDPALVSSCFNVFMGCIKADVNNYKVVIIQGSEQLAAVSAVCFLRIFHHLSVADPGSSVLKDVRHRYTRVFPIATEFGDLPFSYTIKNIHSLAYRLWNPRSIRWDHGRPSTQESISFIRGVAEVAQVEHRRMRYRKVPRWTLRFVLYSLSLDPIPPTSVIADCLSIIAIDLGCDVSNTGLTILNERCVRL